MPETRFMSCEKAGLIAVSGHRRTDHYGKACAHWSATKRTDRTTPALVADNAEKPRKPGLRWYRIWRNPATDPIQRANISRVIRRYNRERRAWNELVQPVPGEVGQLDARAARIWREFQAYHMRGHGWRDIGYHFGVFAHGLVIEGRPFGTHGAHAGAAANHMCGICFVMGPGDVVSPEMVAAAQAIQDRFGVVIEHAHFDFMSTACCGRGPGSITDRILNRKD